VRTKTGLELEIVVKNEERVGPTYPSPSPTRTHSQLRDCQQVTSPFPQSPLVFPLSWVLVSGLHFRSDVRGSGSGAIVGTPASIGIGSSIVAGAGTPSFGGSSFYSVLQGGGGLNRGRTFPDKAE